MAHCSGPAFLLTVRSVSRTFACNPVTPVIDIRSMTSTPMPACGMGYSYTFGGKLAIRTCPRGIVTTCGDAFASELALVTTSMLRQKSPIAMTVWVARPS